MRRTATTFTLLACAGMLLTACGSDQQNSPQTAAQTTAASNDCTQGGKYPTSPTVESLTGLLQKGLDPAVSSPDKIELLQGASGDPELFNRMLPALNQANFSVIINGVNDYCNGTANADATLNFYGQPNQSQVPLIAEDGRWKLERLWACGLAASLQQTSPICT